jgi:DNA recombination protein RmuC
MNLDLILILLAIGFGFAGLYFLITKQLKKAQPKPEEQKEQLEQIINQVFGMSSNKIATQAKQVLEAEKDVIKNDLDNKQRSIEKLVLNLQKDLATRQDEIRKLEQDRTQKFSEINKSLQHHTELAAKLEVSTQALSKVLSNNQARGAWGERIIEDILQANGLQEGTHYLKQSSQTTRGARPDITLILPNHRNVPVDVKFPYSEITKMSEAPTQKAKQEHLKQFERDIKSKIDKVAEYIDPTKETLDYAILFVPNEMVFSFINQKLPQVVDHAISKRVLIVSPFTFLIVARTVLESYRNFMIGDKLKEVIAYIDDFTGEWTKFKDKFEKYGRSIDTLKKDYEALTNTRVRQMDRKIEKIDNVKKGNILEEGEKISLVEPN